MPLSRRNGIDIWYEVAGAGPPLVLVHANPFDHDLWLYQSAHFSTWFRVVNVDIRSYGRSAKVETPFPFDDMVDDVWGVMRDADADHNAVIMGISVGSRLVMRLALDHPDAIRAVVAVGSGAEARGANFDRRIDGYEGDDFAAYHARHLRELVSPEFPKTKLGAHLLGMFSERDPWLSGKAIAQGFRALAVADISDRIGAFETPVLVVNGEFDNALARGRAMAERLPNGRHVMIPGTGHACCLEDPAAFDAAVIDFLQRWNAMPGSPAPASRR
jgi:pimeloyl-ACP methyl ester carboxylesterase